MAATLAVPIAALQEAPADAEVPPPAATGADQEPQADERPERDDAGPTDDRTPERRAREQAEARRRRDAPARERAVDEARRRGRLKAEAQARAAARDTARGAGPTDDAAAQPEGDEASTEQAAPAAPAAPERLLGRDSPDATPSAVEFAELLREVIAQELHVQDFELSTPLAEADGESLSGYKAKRFGRIQQDRTFTKKLGRKLPLYALGIPKPAPDARLSAPDLALLERLKRAHEMTRRTAPLRQWQDANADFLKKGDWARRDRAVQLRDSIIEQESQFTTMINEARDIAAGDGTKAMRNGVVKRLDEIAPASRDDSSDYVKLTMTNPDVRTAVLTEVLTVLGTLSDDAPPPRPEDELIPEVDRSRAALIAKSGLVDVVTRHIEAERELAELDEELDTNENLEPAGRHTLTLERDELERELARLLNEWHGTQPDRAAALGTIELQNELIQRRMLDIGYRAAAFVRQRDTVRELEQSARDGKANPWIVLEEQRELLDRLEQARPAVSPLEGLDAPPTEAEMAAIQSLRQKVQAAVNKAKAQTQLIGGGAQGGSKGKPKKKPKKKKGGLGGLFDDR